MPQSATAPAFSPVPALAEAIERRSTRDIVAEKIAAVITSGVLQIGDSLPGERDLAAALQVSRETVRGGMRILAARGVIEISHGARARILAAPAPPTASGPREAPAMNRYELEAVHRARLLVERTVVAEAAALITAETLEFLEGALEVQRAALNDPVRFLISDREFHHAIYRSSANPVLADFVCDLYTYMLDYRRKVMSRPGAIAKSYEDHVSILAALRAHDPGSVILAFNTHLDRIYVTTHSILKSGDVGRRPRSATRPRAIES